MKIWSKFLINNIVFIAYLGISNKLEGSIVTFSDASFSFFCLTLTKITNQENCYSSSPSTYFNQREKRKNFVVRYANKDSILEEIIYSINQGKQHNHKILKFRERLIDIIWENGLEPSVKSRHELYYGYDEKYYKVERQSIKGKQYMKFSPSKPTIINFTPFKFQFNGDTPFME